MMKQATAKCRGKKGLKTEVSSFKKLNRKDFQVLDFLTWNLELET
jgi:hypothetical protein